MTKYYEFPLTEVANADGQGLLFDIKLVDSEPTHTVPRPSDEQLEVMRQRRRIRMQNEAQRNSTAAQPSLPRRMADIAFEDSRRRRAGP
jgi:hypothetical protein